MDIESNVSQKQIEEYTRLGFYDRWTLCDFIKRWGAALPDKLALIDPRKRLTWAQYSLMMDRMALHFLDLGIKRGDLVIAQIPNSVEAVVIEFALARIGACVVPLPMPWREHELDFVIEQTESPALITVKEYGGLNFLAMARSLQGRHPSIRQILLLGEAGEGAVSLTERWDNPIEEQRPGDYLDRNCKIDGNLVLTMCYTSGTEAQPKGCPRTHNHWKSHVRMAVLNHLMENVNDRVIMALPWFNLFGQCIGILSMALVGGTLILLDGFNPAVMIQTIAQEKATVYAGVPAMHIAMLNYPKLGEYDMSSLRAVVSGGAPCPVAVIEKMMKAYGCLVWNGFGSNEGYVGVAELGSPPEIISTTMGIRMLYADSKIVDKKGKRVGVEEIGEFCQKGPFIMGGYYKRPDLNKKKWDKDGFYHSGDAAFQDKDGYYHFVSRISDIIIRSGMNISAEDVESVLYRHPKVLNAAVVGMPAPVQGERVCAYVELKEGVEAFTKQEVWGFMEAEKVARYKWPDRVEIVTKLPRTPTGKVIKNVLRQEIAEKLAAERARKGGKEEEEEAEGT
jgi:non-ribosomal peptide synthetase component E (peptide arylation enzyme)